MPGSQKSFVNARALGEWLAENHESASELWVRIFKVASVKPSVSWADCVIEAIRYGWIDGQKKSLDDRSFLQRLSPRKPGSSWSSKNCEHANKLIADGRMTAAGLAHVEAAKSDGRWENAYAGSASRQNLFSIYYRLQSAKKPETRAKRMAEILLMLDQEKTLK